eukprot:8149141-Pyramimonas_sp.AAC.1
MQMCVIVAGILVVTILWEAHPGNHRVSLLGGHGELGDVFERRGDAVRGASLLNLEDFPSLDAVGVVQRAFVRVGAQAGDPLSPQVVVQEVLLGHAPQLSKYVSALPDLEGLVYAGANLVHGVVPR